MDKKILLVLSILFAIIAILFLVLVIVLPSEKVDDAKEECKEHSTPAEVNENLWASFPGELKTKNLHTFQIFEYSTEEQKAFLKDGVKLEETTKYENINYSGNKIDFDAVSTFEISKDNLKKNEKINTFSLGLFETLETLSNPQIYQKGISSIEYLIRKAFQSQDLFVRHLFAYNLSITLTQEQIKTLYLNGVDSAKHDKIFNLDSEYSLKTALGFDNWAKLLGNEEKIKNAKWLTDLFGLTDKEIDSIFGNDKNLYTDCIKFYKKIEDEFCPKDKTTCGHYIIYNQLISRAVTNKFNLESLEELYSKIKPDYYPFDKSPEFYYYTTEYKNKYNKKIDAADITVEQLSKLIDKNSEFSLLSANNSIFFLSKVQINDLKAIVDRYNLANEETVLYLCSYFYEYLPKLLLYPKINQNEEVYISPMARTYSMMALDGIKKTYYHMSKIDNFYDAIFTRLVWADLQKEFLNDSMEYDDEDICYLMFQQVLDDGRKVLKICSDPVTSFKSRDDIMKWFGPIFCNILGEDDSHCDKTVITHLKEIIYITESEIKSIFTQFNFEKYVTKNYKILNDYWKDKCEDDEYLLKRQFWKSEVSLNLPEKNSTTFYDIFPDIFPSPFELNYYLYQKKIINDIPENSIDLLITLNPKSTEDILDEDNYQAFNNIREFEKGLTKIINQNAEKGDQYKAFDAMNNLFLFEGDMISEYKGIEDILQGNNIEDKKYIDYLSKGEYYNNYKPKINKTTGFNFGFNLDTGNKVYVPYDKYSMDRAHLRKIIGINNSPYLNIKKAEYDYISNDYIYVDTPILNYQTLKGDKSFVDGFEYNHEEDAIYYFDRMSSRPYKFTYTEEIDYKDQTCKKYVLDTSNIADNINEKDESQKAFISQKFNKPFVISVGKEGLDHIDIIDDISTENSIYVETYSNMVLRSEINLVYSLYTKNYGYLYPEIKNDKSYPLFVYQKVYDVDIDSFNEAFPSINSSKDFKTIFLVIGIIIIVISCCLCIFFCYKYYTHRRSRISLLPEDTPDTKLINDSRDATLNNMA